MAAFIPISLYFSLPGLLLGFLAQFIIRSAWNKYSKVSSEIGVPGAQVARYILDSSGLGHVEVKETRGFLTDHYDPSKKTLRLSTNVYQGNSVAAIGVAAHEVGHALQDSQSYRPLALRSKMILSVQYGSWLGPILFSIGLAIPSTWGRILAMVGLILFSGTVLFALITLPVEYDASKRAKQALVDLELVFSQQELSGVSMVLNAAALTYVAGAVQAFMALLQYLFVFLMLDRKRDKKEKSA
jgi:Zn-dependent membrane protease YugP